MSTTAPSLLPSYAKAAVAALPLAGRLPLLPGGGGPLPTRTWSLEGARLADDKLARIRSLTSDRSSGLPLFAPHLLAFPLHMQAMTDGSFPYPAVGTVHLDNVIERLALIPEDQALDLTISLDGPFTHRKGATFQIQTIAKAESEVVWKGTSTMLRVGAKAPADAGEAPSVSVPDADAPADQATTESWALAEDLGRAWAAASGDRNPIHLHALTAKAFGFPRAIIHGVWTAARIAGTLPIAPQARFGIRFERPILLPGQAQLSHWAGGAGVTEALVRNPAGDKVHARARVTAL